MKKAMLKRLVLAAVVAGSFAAWQPSTEAAVQVNPVAGMPADFIKGCDVYSNTDTVYHLRIRGYYLP